MARLDALLDKMTEPPTPPFAVGEKVTLTARLSPAARICGSSKVETLNRLSVDLTSETVTLDWPWLVATTTRVSVWPTTTPAKRKRGAEKLISGAAARSRGGSVTKTASTTAGMVVADRSRAFDQRSRINQTA